MGSVEQKYSRSVVVRGGKMSVLSMLNIITIESDLKKDGFDQM